MIAGITGWDGSYLGPRDEGRGLVDSDPSKTGSYVFGSVVLGTIVNLSEIQRSTKFNEILVACDPIAPEQMESVIAFARNRDLPVLRFSIAINDLLRPRDKPVTAIGGPDHCGISPAPKKLKGLQDRRSQSHTRGR